MKILNLGSMNLDYVYRVHDFPMPGETITAISQSINPGGKGLNQSIALAKAGAKVSHACMAGVGGNMLIDTMNRYGVDTSLISNCDETQGNAVIYVNDMGENNIVLFSGSNRSLTKAYVCEVLDHFEKGDWLLLQNEVNLLPDIVEEAYKRELNIALNPSPCDDYLKEVDFNKLSMIFINEVEGELLTGEHKPDKILDSFADKYPNMKVILTLGSEGAYYMEKGQTVYRESFSVKAVDTTAAGDTFSGYFLACYMQGMSVSDCMLYSAKAASITVTGPGAGESIPTWTEVVGN